METALITLQKPVPLCASETAARTFTAPWCSYCAEGEAAEAGYALDVRGLFERLKTEQNQAGEGQNAPEDGQKPVPWKTAA